MSLAASTSIVDMLAEAGEVYSDVDPEMRSRLTGIELQEDIDVSAADYRKHRHRIFGQFNPECINNPFWEAMIRTRAPAYSAGAKFGDSSCDREPVWCFQRFGQSFTKLPDGRYVEIAGEHEDFYDRDFCIYNDVVVHSGNGKFDIFGYPPEIFPPTDVHSATYRAPYIYLIGSLGYHAERRYGETPVYRLHCETWSIEKIGAKGENPGWIHKHRSTLIADHEIEILSGKIQDGPQNDLLDNDYRYVLDLTNFTWRREAP